MDHPAAPGNRFGVDASPALSRDSGQTLTEQLAQRFADRIRQHWLASGTRLPSVRECARTHGVSAYTVVAAYEQLLAQGLIEARSQRGYFVRQAPRGQEAADDGKAGTPHPFQPSTPIDATTLIRGMFHEPGKHPMPGLGTLPPGWLDAGMLGAALRRATQGDKLVPLSLHYGEPAGDGRFRRALSLKLAEWGIKAPPEQIITTVGATHALDLVCRTLLQPGDAVLVDEPGWPVEFARLAQLGLRVLPVPRGADGPDLAVLRKLAREHHPKLYVTVSVLHNPTSALLSPGHAHQVLRLAEAHSFHIIEDDIYGFLAPAHATRLAVLDELQRVISVGSFSKILTPSWRVGYIAAPRQLVERITNTKLLTTLTTPPMLEQAVAICLEQGQLRKHSERVIQQLDEARARCIPLIRQAGCRFVAEPQGLFGWIDTGMDTERLTIPMLDAGWLIAPGALFHAQRRPSTLMRINFASSQDARFWKALHAQRGRQRA
jgi:DNA-binding transcriptional MocR family regulator